MKEDLAKFEQSQETATTTTESTPAVDITLTDPTQTASVTEPENTTTQTQDVVEDNTSAFSLAINDDVVKDEVKVQPTVVQPVFNIDEEIKKVDKKELLKKAGVTDFAIEIDEYLAKGGNAIDFLNARAIDYNKVSDEDIIKSDLQKQYPNFSPQQIALMFNRKYNVSEDADPEDKEFAQLQLQADAYNARQQKIQEQSKFKIPDTPILQKDEAYEQWKKEQESEPQLMEKFRSFYETHEATKALNESKRVAINLGEGVPPFNFTIDHPQVLTKALTDGGAILNKLMTTQSGEPDVAKQHLVTLFSFNPEKFIQDIFKYGQSMGVRKELVEEGQNAVKPQAKVAPLDPSAPPKYKTGTYGTGG